MKRDARWRLVVGSVLLLGTLGGCSSLFGSAPKGPDSLAHDENPPVQQDSEGDNEGSPALGAGPRLTPDKNAASILLRLPNPENASAWSQAGGSATHAGRHLALLKSPWDVWSVSIGEGSGRDAKILGTPVVSQGRVFALDAEGHVSAWQTEESRHAVWTFDTAPPESDGEALGGGLAVDGARLVVTTGWGEVIALAPSTGKVLWRVQVGKPLRAAPTLAGGRVLVVTFDNELQALDLKDGHFLWKHNGIAENATLMGSASPAAEDETVIAAYGSGEVFALRAENGRVLWSDTLAARGAGGSLPSLPSIRGLPVLDRDLVIVMSHNGRLVALNALTGERAWEVEVGGVSTPLVVGEAVIILTNDNDLAALSRADGRVVWVKSLQRLAKPGDPDSDPVFWQGPILAGGQVWLTNSLGQLVAFAPTDGQLRLTRTGPGPFFLPPISAAEVLYVLSDDGTLQAWR